jgi:hypothetical protein
MDEPKPTPLGQLVLQRGLLDEAQLEVALAEHLSSGKQLGEVIVDHGWMSPEQLAELLGQQEEGARGVDLLRSQVAAAAAEADLEPEAEGEADEVGPNTDLGHLLFVWAPAGYELLSRTGEPPRVGDEVSVGGGPRVVTKIGPSPLPGDARPCAFLDAPG